MNRDRRVRIYDLHAWAGISLGLFVFVVSFTGCLALFDHELKTWEDPAKRLPLPESIAPIHDQFTNWVNNSVNQNKANQQEIRFVSLQYPSHYEPYYLGRLFVKNESGKSENYHQRWRADNAETIPERGEGLTTWLLDFHRDLMWPTTLGGRTAGRTIVGVAGIILLLSIISGVITHRKMLQELFTLRVNRSVRLKWKDVHNILGLWGIPFYTMIAFTGAFLGVVAILVPLTGALIAKGDTEKLRAVIVPPSTEAAHVKATSFSLDELYQLKVTDTDARPKRVSIVNWSDQNAIYSVNYPADNKLQRTHVVEINGVTGDILPTPEHLRATAVNRTQGAITPLHYGSFGGIAVKFLYLMLGLSLCVMIVLGIMVWVERRLNSPVGTKEKKHYLRIGQLTTGMVFGNVLASVAIFYFDKLYFGGEENRLFYTGITYFLTWLLTIVYAFSQLNGYKTTRIFTLNLSLGLFLLPIINYFSTGNLFINQLFEKPTSADWVDLTFIVSAIILFLLYKKLPNQRAEEKRKSNKEVGTKLQTQ
ncbi:PepSY-associated TM helix domain-containing protein [Sessilibacter corallicola]|uniref:PepSY-associated TM helix domain-containing protein n=1 Tax=Sessilibacter corallicola TaxID=2904075 RepID=A0ABQ0A4W1_9GAMM